MRSTAFVAGALLVALVLTGFVSSAYERERSKLGDRHFRSGQRLTTVNDLTGAAEEFRKALLFAPDMQEYRLSLATALLSSGKLDEAESHLEQLAQEDPTNGRINLLLARVALREHHTDQALESFQRAVYEYWPSGELGQRRQARWELIDLLESAGKHRDQLVGELLQLYANLPPQSDQRLRVASVLLRNGADAEAAHVFRDVLQAKAVKSVEGANNQLAAHLGLARVAFHSGDFVEARHEYQRALRDNSKNPDATAGLQLTDEIINIAPQLPNLSANERVRRSQNLLLRVEAELKQCSAPANAAALDQRLQAIAVTNREKLTDKDDTASALQQTALDLWKDRALFCDQPRPKQPALDAVLPRLGHEQ